MIYNNKKHFYDPYDSLDAEWKARISHEMLSVGEAAQLSGFSRQYINKLILPITPTSPIGYSSYSLKELMRYTGMSRCWVLKFATRNSIPSYYVGMYRRFCKSVCEEAWKRESISLKRWLTIEEACALFDIDEEVIFALAALHRIRVKRLNKNQVYSKADILFVVKKGGTSCHELF